MAHINLTRHAHAILVAPASADFMAKLLHGRADDLLSLMCLARPMDTVPLLLAPAMNKEMWAHPATQRNMAQLRQDGAIVLGVGQGDQACGEVGDGRMLEPDELLYELTALFQPKVLQGKKILISAGPTYEAMDPVRGITNLSSGKMGFALARAAHEAGASVQLVAGPVNLPTPYGVARTDVRSALDMHAAVMAQANHADIFIATAAVADWRPAQAAAEKIKKGSEGLPNLDWVENPDILADVATLARSQAGDLYCVGFAAETQYLQAQAQAKRERKGVPLMVGNLGPATFGQDDNALLVIDEQGVKELPRAAKLILARQLVADIAMRISTKTKG
jgi:phosphopantothenoylcysteine decarboxylase/phosphopantothenate--cysteine ligase